MDSIITRIGREVRETVGLLTLGVQVLLDIRQLLVMIHQTQQLEVQQAQQFTVSEPLPGLRI